MFFSRIDLKYKDCFSSPTGMKKVVSLKGGSPWGFRLVGGSDFRTQLAISKTTFGGKADAAGLKPTDVILAINKAETISMTHNEAKEAVKNAGHVLTLEIQCGQDLSMTKLTSKMNETTLLPAPPANLPPPPANLPPPPANLLPPPADDSFPPPPPASIVQSTATSLPPPPADFLPSPPSNIPPAAPVLSPQTVKTSSNSTTTTKNFQIGSNGRSSIKRDDSDDFVTTTHQKPRNDSTLPSGSLTTNPGSGEEVADGRKIFCEDCKMEIKGPYVSALGKTWHPECFVCSKCNKTLQNCGFIEEKGRRYCQDCYETHFARMCRKCGKRIFGNSVAALDSFWHPECFVCAVCGEPFGGNGFIVHEGLPYCEKDYNERFSIKCCGCSGVIGAGQNYVEAANSQYHSTCFKCAVCGLRLENSQFFVSAGKIKCMNHRCA